MNNVSEMVGIQEREHGVHCRDIRAMAIRMKEEEALGSMVGGDTGSVISDSLFLQFCQSCAALCTCSKCVPEPIVGYRGTVEHTSMRVVGTACR